MDPSLDPPFFVVPPAPAASQAEAGVPSEHDPSPVVESDPEIGQFSSQSQASSVGPIDSFSESQSILRHVSTSKVPNSSVPDSNVEISNVADNSAIDNPSEDDNNEIIVIDSGDLLGSKTPVTYNSGNKANDNCSEKSSKNVNNDSESVEASPPDESMELEASGSSKPRARSRDDSDGGGFLSKIPCFSPRKLIAKTSKPKLKLSQGRHSQLPPVMPARAGKK